MSFIDGTQISSNVVTRDHLAHFHLLAQIHSQQVSEPSKIYAALLAVVNFHHPCFGDEHDDDPDIVNDSCICMSEPDVEYPCKTMLLIMEAMA